MSKSLQQVLGYVTLTKSIQAITSGIPNPLPPGFMKATTKTVGDKGRYTRVTGQRQTSRLTKYGSPASNRELLPVAEVDVKLLHSFENEPLDPLVMKQLRSKNEYELDMGLDEVKRQISEFKRLFENLRIATTMQVLKSGVLYWDGNGNLLPTSSGAIETHSFQMNANNQNQLNGIISASWALYNTDIPLQLRKLKKQALRTTGYPLRYAMYGENVPSYLSQNQFVIDYLSRNPTMQAKWLESAEIPDGLFGFTWIPVYEAFYQDSTATNQDLWSPDNITFTPEVSEEWWDVLEGSYEVPTSINNAYPDADAAMRSMATVYGQFGYGVVSHNPPTVIGYYGDTFIPALKNPDVIYQADVAF